MDISADRAAGTPGIADQIRDQMARDGLTAEQATRQIWIVDLPGLLADEMGEGLLDYQRSYARPCRRGRGLGPHAGAGGSVRRDPLAPDGRVAPGPGLIGHHHPGNRGRAGQADDPDRGLDVARGLYARSSRGHERGNAPAGHLPGLQSDLPDRGHAGRRHRLVKGTALVATGLPIPPVDFAGVRYRIGQANNALLYPGLGLGTIVSGASKVTDAMLLAAAEAVAGQADVSAPGASLLPAVENLRASSATTAIAVARAASDDGVATRKADDLVQAVQDAIWQPSCPDSVS